MTPLQEAAHKVERDDLSARYETASRLVTSLSDALAKALKERDALKAELARPESTVVSLMRAENAALKGAARLALDALENIPTAFGNIAYTKDVQEAIAALEAVYLHPPQPQATTAVLHECWYESNELKVCRKCGQLHDKAIAAQGEKP